MPHITIFKEREIKVCPHQKTPALWGGGGPRVRCSQFSDTHQDSCYRIWTKKIGQGLRILGACNSSSCWQAGIRKLRAAVVLLRSLARSSRNCACFPSDNQSHKPPRQPVYGKPFPKSSFSSPLYFIVLPRDGRTGVCVWSKRVR